mgnify:CR=1 FL=1
MKHKSFIVPHDFTQVATVALNHAIETSKRVNTTIHILHVVDKQEENLYPLNSEFFINSLASSWLSSFLILILLKKYLQVLKNMKKQEVC